MNYMGEKDSSRLMRKIDHFLRPLYKILPFTYTGIYLSNFKDLISEGKKATLLDLGCGDGSAMESVGLPKNFEITGVDIFGPYLKLAHKKRIYKRLIKQDVRKITTRKKYDVVVANHILEHMTANEGKRFLEKLEKIAKRRIIIAAPIGNLPQEEYDENPHQLHKSSWTTSEMIKRGYRVKAQGLKILWGNENIVAKYGIFSYFLFFLSVLSTPLMRINPELGTYMICEKDIEK